MRLNVKRAIRTMGNTMHGRRPIQPGETFDPRIHIDRRVGSADRRSRLETHFTPSGDSRTHYSRDAQIDHGNVPYQTGPERRTNPVERRAGDEESKIIAGERNDAEDRERFHRTNRRVKKRVAREQLIQRATKRVVTTRERNATRSSVVPRFGLASLRASLQNIRLPRRRNNITRKPRK